MLDKILYIVLGVSAAAAICIGIYIIRRISERIALSRIYGTGIRDERFATSLLSFVFGDKIIKNPYILEDGSKIPPNTAAAFVCSGGVALISICRGHGQFVAPDSGRWTLDDGGRVREIDNIAARGEIYAAELSGLIMRRGLVCPMVRHYVFLTDDDARYDFRSSDSVLGGAALIAELKNFAQFGALGKKDRLALCELIERHSESMKAHFAELAKDETVKTLRLSDKASDDAEIQDDLFADIDAENFDVAPDPIAFDPIDEDVEDNGGKTIEMRVSAPMSTTAEDNDEEDDEFDIKVLFGRK